MIKKIKRILMMFGKIFFAAYVSTVIVWAGEYEIKYYAPKAEKVSIAGDFNGWNPDEFPMEKIDGGYFSKTLELEPGVHEYKVIIDGEWLDGANLKYDTALRQTIITSNFAWSPKIFWSGKFLVNVSSSGAESCHSLQGKITLNNNVSGMFIINSSGRDGRLNSNAEKLSIVYRAGLFDLNSFYNLRVFQSPDPMRLLQRRSIPLRQQEIVFCDETNPAEDFGLGAQGILMGFGGEGKASANLLISDDYETEEDTLFASAGIGGIRAEYLSRKGIDFPFASSSHWFPDPDVAQTWFGSSNALDWYKGFNEESELSLDAQAEQGRAVYFGQCVLIDKMLHAVRWNEGGLGDSGIDKKWRFYEAKKYTAGVKYKGPVSAQCSYASENGKFSEFWNFNTKSEKYSFLARWNFADSYIGAKTAIIKNHIPAGYNVHDDFDPYSINYYYGKTGRYESWKEYWLLGNFKGRNYNLKLAAKFFPAEKIKEAVITAEKSISLFSFKFSPLYFSDGVKNYLCSSFSAGVKKGALSVEAGAGMSPEDFSLTDESDRREDFLYNQNSWDKGYELLKEQEKIWLRAVLSF